PPLTHCILLSSVPHLTLHTFPTRRSSDLCFSFQHHSTNSSIDSKCTFISSPPCKILSNPYLVSYRFSAPFPGLVCVDRSQSDCRSEDHTSELQSRFDLVCRLLLDKENQK